MGGENVATFFADGANSRVGIATTNPTTGRLHVIGGADLPAIYGESANRGVWGHCTGASRGVYGDSVSGEGVHGESTSGTGVAGVTASANIASPGVGGASTGNGGVGVRGDGTTGIFGRSASDGGIGVNGTATGAGGAGVYGESASGFAMSAAGNTTQSRDKGGWVKAMAFYGSGSGIVRCFNSQLSGSAASTAPCGFQVSEPNSGYVSIDFGFTISDRFISVTPHYYGHSSAHNYGANFRVNSSTIVDIQTFAANDPDDTISTPFMIFIF